MCIRYRRLASPCVVKAAEYMAEASENCSRPISSALRFRTGFYMVGIRSIWQGLPHKRTAYRLAIILLLRPNRNI